MSQTTTYECDVCHSQKETNHWWKGWLVFRANSDIVQGVQIASEYYSEWLNKHEVDLCGFECATAWLKQKMQEIRPL